MLETIPLRGARAVFHTLSNCPRARASCTNYTALPRTVSIFLVICIWKLKQEGRVLSCLTSARNIWIKWFKFFMLCACLQWLPKYNEYWFWGHRYILQWAGKYTKVEFINNEDRLYLVRGLLHGHQKSHVSKETTTIHDISTL